MGSGPLPTGKSPVAVGSLRNTDILRSSMVQLILEGSPYGRLWMKYVDDYYWCFCRTVKCLKDFGLHLCCMLRSEYKQNTYFVKIL